jgi:RNA polymerase-interacting CarD/CdnL/TRCF family regulator
MPGEARRALRLELGDLVVYRGHGIGRISAIRAAEGGGESLVVELHGTLTVTLPSARAHESLRGVSGEPELRVVRDVLREAGPPPEASWSRRFRTARELVSGGEAAGLAEVVREGIRRERRSAATGRGPASPGERELYLTARRLLAHEVSVSREVDLDEADRWIADQVGPAPDDAATRAGGNHSTPTGR